MAERVAPTVTSESGTPISAEEYLAQYAHDFYEWEDGRLVKMSPVNARHDDLTGYLRAMFWAYFTLRPIGVVRQAPFVLRLDASGSYREPDLQIILHGNPGQLTDTAMIGPADICVEVVSPESVARDHGTKLAEYEKAGVKEYWIVDPLPRDARFLRLNAQGIYEVQQPDADGYYHTPLLPGFRLHVPTLWADKLPDIITLVEEMRRTLGE